uniref:Rho termination factor-like N-terminal domain-containing protein n=1 Tax=Streptomyces sp. NBC_00093 TaxID=2975649 RepID=A0AAU1ZZF2_9ACTN
MRVEFTRPVASPGLSAHAGQILDLPEDEALQRIEAGHCTAVDQPKPSLREKFFSRKGKSGSGTAPAAEPDAKPLDKMTVEQLRAYADEHDISLPEDGKKADLLAAIEAELADRE